MTTSKITWTKIDEAPALASYSLLPIVEAYTRGTGRKSKDSPGMFSSSETKPSRA